MWVLDKDPRRLWRACPLPTESICETKALPPPSAGLPSPSSLTRCHLSQSERPWQSVKFPVYTLRPAAAKRAVRRYAETFRLCQGLPLWGSWREAPERARMLTRSCALGLALPCGSTALSEAQSKPRPCAASAGLALSVIASRCHLSQSERPWQSAKFPVYTLRPAAARGAVRRCAQTFRLCQGLPLWGSWQSRQALTERASPLPVGLHPGLTGAYGRKRTPRLAYSISPANMVYLPRNRNFAGAHL